MVVGQDVFLLLPDPSKKRVLAPGKISLVGADQALIYFEDALEIACGLEAILFFEVRGKFLQQGATLQEIKSDGSQAGYCFQRVGEIVSAEQRQTFRVSVAVSMIYADFARQKQCHVVDFSPEGLAIIARPGFAVGSSQPIALRIDDVEIKTDGRIQTVKQLPSGKMRYGLLIDKSNTTARKALQKISIISQRTQLKRLAGAA